MNLNRAFLSLINFIPGNYIFLRVLASLARWAVFLPSLPLVALVSNLDGIFFPFLMPRLFLNDPGFLIAP